MAKSVRESKKNFWISVAGAIVLISLAAYLILPNLLTKTDSPSQSLEQAVNSRTAYSFVKQGELSFNDSKSNFITRIEIEIADTDDKRTTGLMFRDRMDETQGMLFIFPEESEQAFWMKNTILPLDIIFVNSKMDIVKIQKNAEPYSEKSLPSVKPAQYVVEVNAGYCDKFGVKDGDKIVWRRE